MRRSRLCVSVSLLLCRLSKKKKQNKCGGTGFFYSPLFPTKRSNIHPSFFAPCTALSVSVCEEGLSGVTTIRIRKHGVDSPARPTGHHPQVAPRNRFPEVRSRPYPFQRSNVTQIPPHAMLCRLVFLAGLDAVKSVFGGGDSSLCLKIVWCIQNTPFANNIVVWCKIPSRVAHRFYKISSLSTYDYSLGT